MRRASARPPDIRPLCPAPHLAKPPYCRADSGSCGSTVAVDGYRNGEQHSLSELKTSRVCSCSHPMPAAKKPEGKLAADGLEITSCVQVSK